MSRPLGRTIPWGGRVDHGVSFFGKLTIASVFLLLHASVDAQERDVLTLARAVALVSEDQPQLAALLSQEQAALESSHAERELPDPRLAFGVENLPMTGDDAFRFGREDMTMITVGLMQDVVTRAKREASSSRMSAEAARLSAERMLNARTLQRDVALAWIDAFEAQQRAATLRKLLAEITAEREVSAAQVSSGAIRASEVLALDLQRSSTRDDLILAERDEAQARAALSRWIGEAALRPLPDALPQINANIDPAAAARAIDSHPALQSSSHAIDAALRAVDRARADRRPDWSWQLMYGQRQDDRSDLVTFQVTVGLPWNRADRQDRRIAQKLAEASALRSDLSDRRRALEAELASIRADLNASAQRLDEHEEQLAPNARTRLEALQAAYAGGKGSLVDVWEARRAWIEAGLHHQMILADRARALAKLAWLTGRAEVLP
ncbi:MAG TPA: TolC family protein [Steroidobacter sp.]|uniref:TolC family protein n=1 Tax=Steroidobacter sp. TaxID=1978227 RepID=UPI002ED8D158